MKLEQQVGQILGRLDAIKETLETHIKDQKEYEKAVWSAIDSKISWQTFVWIIGVLMAVIGGALNILFSYTH